MKMKHLIVGFLVAVSGQAVAADHDWSGPYVGFNLASNQGDSRSEVTQSGSWSIESVPFRSDVANAWNTTLNAQGTGVGVQLGYDFQSGNDWVFGLSVEYSDLNANDARLTAQTPVTSAPSVTYSYGNSVDAKSSWGVRSRLGYAYGKSLFYVSMGWMAAHAEGSAEIFSGTNGYSKLGLGGDTVTGMTYGLGWEYAFKDNCSLQLDYQRSNLSDFAFTTAYRAGSTFPGYIETFKQGLEMNSFRIGLNYRF